MSLKNPIKTLNPEVARKIAAGEVIDRPNAIIRELLDNSVDSGATAITVEINGGGIDKIRVIDNGSGMTKEDLSSCARPHATSKISSENDLLNLSTLGFRGEALSSICAVSRLSITSGSWKMNASITEDHIVTPANPVNGTIVMSEGLFENFPARRQFLKRAATEGVMCKNTFIEKAMAKPEIAFKFISDGETKINLPEKQSLRDRFVQAGNYSEDKALFFEVKNQSSSKYTDEKTGEENPDWQFSVIIGEPSVARSNKKDIYIFTNGRRIQEYSLVQAVEYGGQGYFPNGTYPVAGVFIQINPKLVDFNIHPAKKEARFSDIADLHHGLSSALKEFFHSYTYSNFLENKSADEQREFDFGDNNPSISNPKAFEPAVNFSQDKPSYESSVYERHIGYKSSETAGKSLSDFRSKYLGIRSASENDNGVSKDFVSSSSQNVQVSLLAEQALASFSENKAGFEKQERDFSTENLLKNDRDFKFIGCCLGTFLLAEKNNTLFFIDQHAAHERIIFDKIMNSQGARQDLLVSYKIRTESKSQDNQLEKLKDRLTKIGFTTVKIEDGLWEIQSVPQRWTGSEYELKSLLFVKQVEPEQIIRSIAAMTACKAAVKDGYVLDNDTAAKLVEQAFKLEDPHCPHGRPIYTVISKEKLFELVKRT